MAFITIERSETLPNLRSPEPRDMFTGRDLYRVQLLPGIQLYKLTGGDAVVAGHLAPRATGLATPWWFSYEPQMVDAGQGQYLRIPGIDTALLRSRQAKAPLAEFARARGAVNLTWGNPMDHLLIVRLAVPAVGLVGRCSPQLRSGAHTNVHFIGGDLQFYLPGLAPANVHVVGIDALKSP
jgi:hypothetical protein